MADSIEQPNIFKTILVQSIKQINTTQQAAPAATESSMGEVVSQAANYVQTTGNSLCSLFENNPSGISTYQAYSTVYAGIYGDEGNPYSEEDFNKIKYR